ncbi:MAG: GNAT family N-acetyltransferase [Candidatus Hydrogenedentes bacterium]|nr:GNAT family N-acetyltransferase [Candidatus Hydrogenedentota bacterium]
MNSMEMQQLTLTQKTFAGIGDLDRRSPAADVIVLPGRPGARYLAGYAVSPLAIEATQKLRYQVFNVELGEGLAESALTGLDRDEFDDHMAHLVLLEHETGCIVGTYRIQAAQYALDHGVGLYSAIEYDLAPLGPYVEKTLELGRACLAQDHRALQAIITLWSGLGHYMNLYELHFLMGCCSITTADPLDGWRALKTLREKHFLHPELYLRALPANSCGDPGLEFDPALGDAIPLPKLFRTYMRLGTQVISEPAIDRDFGTVDFLAMMDGREVALSQLDLLR